MGFFERGLLAVYTLTVTILVLLSTASLLGLWTEPLDIILNAPNNPDESAVLWTSTAALVLVGAWLFWASLRPTNEQRAVVQEYSLGQVRISLSAIEELVKKAALKVEGVRDVKPKIIPGGSGISINIKATVAPDINIPEASRQMQYQVKEYILEITGISVQNVKIMIESISANRTRVE
ncbi:MAG: alkaline shock response membrane anchor protein AmaP [Desulfotomaculum sp.]|nr:alkaline shock response membrane anchor protein AmaP [Desulfotomaculum sp.]